MITELVLGEYGGMAALTFGFGAAAGYGFAQKTSVTEAKNRINAIEAAAQAREIELKEHIEKLDAKVDAVTAELHSLLREDRSK